MCTPACAFVMCRVLLAHLRIHLLPCILCSQILWYLYGFAL